MSLNRASSVPDPYMRPGDLEMEQYAGFSNRAHLATTVKDELKRVAHVFTHLRKVRPSGLVLFTAVFARWSNGWI